MHLNFSPLSLSLSLFYTYLFSPTLEYTASFFLNKYIVNIYAVSLSHLEPSKLSLSTEIQSDLIDGFSNTDQ